MGNERAHAPAVEEATAKTTTFAEPEEADRAQPVALDSARTASLLLRQVTAGGERVYQSGGIGQAIAFARRLDDVLDEVGSLERLQPASVSALGPELARARETATRVASRLAPDAKLSAYAADVLAKLDALKPAPGVTPAAAATAPTDLSTAERIELVRLELAAAGEQVRAVLASHPTTQDAAAAGCAPIKGHLGEARNAALGIERFTRAPLYADVDQISRELDGVERALTVDPRFAWHAAFAGAFDAENRLRSAVGLHARPRAYTGTLDPEAAAKQVRETLEKAAETASDDPIMPVADATPQGAIVNIGFDIANAYDRMHDTMIQFQADLGVTDPPKLSIGDMLLNAAVGALIDVATAGLSSVLSGALGKAFGTAGARPATTAGQETAQGAERAAIPRPAPTALESRITGLLKAAGAKAQITPPAPASPTLLNYFVAIAIARITGAKLNSSHLIAGLSEALAQLEPAVLIALETELRKRVNEPALAVEARALIEYEKLRTANAVVARAGHADPLLDAKHLGSWRDEDIAGALEVGLDVSIANEITFAHLRLQGGEPAARLRLHTNKQAIGGLGLHRVFQVRFAAARPTPGLAMMLGGRDYISFGVGATEGLQLETLDEREWLWLRLLAANRPVDDLQALALDLHELGSPAATTPQEVAAQLRRQLEQRISRDAALAKARSLIAFGDTLTTDKVEP